MLKTIKFYILLLLLSVSLVFSADVPKTFGAMDSNIPYSQKTKLLAPLQNFAKTTDFGYFYKEFALSFKPGLCGKGLDKAIGLKAHMVEPIGYFETTTKPMHFPFADIDLGGGSYKNMIKAGVSKNPSKESAARDAFTYSHFIYAPLFGMIFKKKVPVFCFSTSSLGIPFLSEFFPPYKKDIIFKNLVGPMTFMFTPQGMLSTILNCTATIGSEALAGGEGLKENALYDKVDKVEANEETYDPDSTKSSSLAAMTFIRNSMFYSVGCHGFAPIGGYVPGDDPNLDGELLLYSTLNILHGASAALPAPILYKQTNFGMNGGKNGAGVKVMDSMCSPQKYASAIESQYTTQLVYPVVDKNPHELGMPPAQTRPATNVAGAKDSVVYLVWQRRDYFAFAYECPGK